MPLVHMWFENTRISLFSFINCVYTANISPDIISPVVKKTDFNPEVFIIGCLNSWCRGVVMLTCCSSLFFFLPSLFCSFLLRSSWRFADGWHEKKDRESFFLMRLDSTQSVDFFFSSLRWSDRAQCACSPPRNTCTFSSEPSRLEPGCLLGPGALKLFHASHQLNHQNIYDKFLKILSA